MNNQHLMKSCPACGEYEHRSTGITIKPSGRAETIYFQCDACHSYFNPAGYEPNSEIVHTKTMSWGRSDLAKPLEVHKGKMYRSVLALLQKYVLPPASLLDVGCGFGGFLREAREAGYSVSGIDIVPEAVDAVRSQGFSAEQRFSLADVSFKHNSMDIISMLDVNMYFPDQPGELKSAYNLLRTKGFLVMRVVDKSWMFHLGLILSGIRPDLGQGMLRRAINDHRFSMPVKSLLKILKHSGFDVVYASPVGGLHSNNSSMAVKMSFAIGALVWSVSKRFMAPGALILAQKPAK